MANNEEKSKRPIFHQDDKVRVVYNGRAVFGYVKLASPNGKSLMLFCPDVMLAGYLELVPVIWSESAQSFVDIIDDQVFEVTPAVN